MISREKLLVVVASDIADCANLDRQRAMEAARAAMNALGLHVILPLLDVLEFDARPLYRQRVISEVRDILSDDSLSENRVEKGEIHVRD